VSKHISLKLHAPEETLAVDFCSALTPVPGPLTQNPISDYFATTGTLVQKIVSTKYADDAEVLGLLVLGVLSSAEFYFRRVLSEVTELCPVCKSNVETVNVPAASTGFYANSGFAATFSAFEHESLADSKKITSEIRRFAGLNCSDNSSAKVALDEFETLCELRHCLVHARGFAGLKATRVLKASRVPQKVLMSQVKALELIKVAHNAVRAVNRYLSDEIVNRWIDKEVLSGTWNRDKKAFTRWWNLFVVFDEDEFSGLPVHAYARVKPIVVKRLQAIAASANAAA
jgi:hypothetical protein